MLRINDPEAPVLQRVKLSFHAISWILYVFMFSGVFCTSCDVYGHAS